MAWDLQQNMHGYIAPTIWLKLSSFDHEEEAWEWLADRLSDNTFDREDDPKSSEDWLMDIQSYGMEHAVDILVEMIISIGTVTNGGHAFWMDDGGWTTMEWCSEEEMLQWWANQ